MKSLMLSAAMIVAASLSVPAVAADNSVYLGASLGQAKVDFDDLGSDVVIRDDKDTSWKIFAGYNLNENVAFELAYQDFGTVEAAVSGTDVDVSADGYSVSVLGKLPVSDSFSLFGRLGYIHIEAEGESSGIRSTADSNEAIFGLGADYALNENVFLRAEWERVNSDDELDVLSVGVAYNF